MVHLQNFNLFGFHKHPATTGILCLCPLCPECALPTCFFFNPNKFQLVDRVFTQGNFLLWEFSWLSEGWRDSSLAILWHWVQNCLKITFHTSHGQWTYHISSSSRDIPWSYSTFWLTPTPNLTPLQTGCSVIIQQMRKLMNMR